MTDSTAELAAACSNRDSSTSGGTVSRVCDYEWAVTEDGQQAALAVNDGFDCRARSSLQGEIAVQVAVQSHVCERG
jgi:hypothetical protein